MLEDSSGQPSERYNMGFNMPEKIDVSELYPDADFWSQMNLSPAELEKLISSKNYGKFAKLGAKKELENFQDQLINEIRYILGDKKFQQEEKQILKELRQENNKGESLENEEKPKVYAEGGVVWTDLVDGKGEDTHQLSSTMDQILINHHYYHNSIIIIMVLNMYIGFLFILVNENRSDHSTPNNL